jgi:hypothetical protein
MSLAAERFLALAGARLADLSADLQVAESPYEVAWMLCRFCGQELELADCVIYLLDERGCSLSQQAAWGPKQAAHHVLESRLQLALGQGIVGRCAQLPNLSELAVPIMAGDVLFGVLDSEHPDAGYYDLPHEHAFLAIAERGALRLQALIDLNAPGA